ncbi:phage tail tube protein [Veillonella criceti]|uniref:Predicted secreted protein n=1 Tax=Veillonella criceti TaxID=103891 RepID=A0A380NJ51_9FIRM|nr:phage major tail protein, TP901-1 family [Veillonella criceti]SUP42247.1 Predicted secreted protein [Veillonella criceti]
MAEPVVGNKVRAKRTATADKLLGKEVLLYINFGVGATEDSPKWTLIGGQTTADFSMSADEIDANNKASNGWGESYAGIKSTELALEGILCKSDDGIKAVKEAFLKGESVDICRYAIDGTADRNWYNITEFSDKTPHDDMATFSITLKGIGEPKFYSGKTTVDDVKGTANA